MSMNHSPNPKDDELERMKAEFLAKGGAVTVGKTKPMPTSKEEAEYYGDKFGTFVLCFLAVMVLVGLLLG